MGHIFISYSHKDSEYAHALADRLQSMGFAVWIDARLDYGSQWPHKIQEQLDSCDAFILIMSPRSFVSEWVQGELQRAKRKAKPVFPLLLEGDEPWLSVESIQYYDVRNRRLPDDEFFADLKHVLSGEQTSGHRFETWGPAPKPEPAKHSPSPLRTVSISAAIAGFIAVAVVCLVMGVLLLRRLDAGGAPSFVSTGVDNITAGSNPASTAALPSTALSPIPTVATPMVLTVQLPDGEEVVMIDPNGNRYRYTILSAERQLLPPGRYLLHLRIRAWTDGGMVFWVDSFRLAAGDLSLAPVNRLSVAVRANETVDGDVDFEIDTSLKEAILRISLGPYPWATKELRLVFP
jgi:hypothetical protein